MARIGSVVYSTADTAGVAAFVAALYPVEGPLSCGFLHRGFNDTYAIEDGRGRRFIFRLSTPRAHRAPDTATETAMLAYLAQAGVPVAAPVPTRDDRLWCIAELPEGARPAVLFHEAPGRRPDLDRACDAHAQGATLARIHTACGGAKSIMASARGTIDLDRLVASPLAAIRRFGSVPDGPLADLAAFCVRLVASLDRPALTSTYCHGDCHGLNARVDDQGVAWFFDFDDGGPGPLAYDLAVHLWAQVSFGRQRIAQWYAFLAGYESVRPIDPVDLATVPAFVAARHLWLLGQYASQEASWGREVLSGGTIEREIAFLLGWETRHLGPQLV